MLLGFLITGRGVVKEVAPKGVQPGTQGQSHCGVGTKMIEITVHFLRLKWEGNKIENLSPLHLKKIKRTCSFRIKSKLLR